jgi:superfamily II DNA or RNA helicase
VIPTAGGKSLVMAAFIDGVLKAWPDQRVLVVTHVRELIAQNHAEMLGLWPEAPAGIYSAGPRPPRRAGPDPFRRHPVHPRQGGRIGHADLVLIDEAHLIPGRSNTMYRRFLDDLQKINPALKVIGLTATPFRLDSGMLHEGENALFTEIAYEVSVRDLIDQGYLSPLISKQTQTRLDVTGVGSRGGEFIARDLEDAVDQDAITRAAVAEVIAHGATRRSWLAFCSGVATPPTSPRSSAAAGSAAHDLRQDTPKDERDGIIAAFKRGEIRALASMGVLTTGFNAPGRGLIAMLRPTKSAGLYVQMAGRGTRLAEGKENCLVLDFAGNVRRHGPIDLVRPKRPGGPGDGPPPTKICPECGTIVAIALSRMSRLRLRVPRPRGEARADRLDAGGPVDRQAAMGRRHRRHLQPPREARRAGLAEGHLSLRSRLPHGMGLLRARGLSAPEGRELVARAGARVWTCPSPSMRPSSWRTSCAVPPRSPSAPRAASPKSPPTGSPHALRPCRALRRLPPRTPRLGLVRRALPRLRPAARHEPQRPLQPDLPGHLPPEVGHDRSDPQ